MSGLRAASAQAGALSAPAAGSPALPVPEGQAFPLGYAQLCFWFVHAALGETANTLSRLMLDGMLDVRTMEKALAHMLHRHDALRASICPWNPVQRIQPFQPFDLPYTDVSALDAQALEATVGAVTREMAGTPFDLARPPLLRARLLRLGPSSHLMLLCFPHIVADGGAVHLFEQQLLAAYRSLAGGGRPAGREQTLQIADFVAWERARHARGGEAALAFWRAQLDGHPYARFPQPLLAQDGPQPIDRYMAFPDDSFERLGALARRHKASLQMCLIAAIGWAVHRVTGQRRFSLNSVLEGREDEGTEGLMAALLRVMPVPLAFEGEVRFEAVLADVRKNVLAAYEHRDCPWSVPVGVLAEQRWRDSPRLYRTAIRAGSRLFAGLFRRARLYPRFLADFLFMEPHPPRSLWPRRRARGPVADPVINVNMLQSVFKREHEHEGGGTALRATQVKDPERLLQGGVSSSTWEDDSINFYIIDTGRETPSIRMTCASLNAQGAAQLLDAVAAVLRAACADCPAPEHALNHMD